KVRRVKHHAALNWQEAPEFWKSLKESESISAAATGFTILTATRSSEVRLMRRREVDVTNAVWTIPGERMKAGKEHRVPLTPEALALIGIEGSPDALVFESPMNRGRPLSDMSLTAVLKRMGRDDITVHGFRSTFRDWAGETTGHPREVIEHALAHQIKDKAEAAYARGDLFTKRRRLMEDWAAFVTSVVKRDAESSNVVALPAQAAN
ncbi:MAG: site-specific integrase, partial [Pseudomonadota bacterium]